MAEALYNSIPQFSGHAKTIRELLGLEEQFVPMAPDFAKGPSPSPLPVAEELPVRVEEEPKEESQIPGVVETVKDEHEPLEEFIVEERVRLIARDYVRYPLIFIVALLFFYLVLNFGAVATQIGRLFAPPQESRQKVLTTDDMPGYYNWLRKYYVYAADQKILAPAEDPDRDSLTNRDEYYLGTNPLKADTDGDGYDDGEEVVNGYNPLYVGRINTSQEKSIEKKVDLGIVQSRKDAETYQLVAGSSTDLPVSSNFSIDLEKAGNIQIEKIGVDLPVVWTQDFAKIQDDLKYGVVHHPYTPYPGERGMASIHGHSSGDPWDGNFKTAFTKLNFLAEGDDVWVTVFGYNDQSRKYHYVVRSGKVYEKNDPKQFTSLGGYHLNLSTSWPIGTAHKRYVVTTELVGN